MKSTLAAIFLLVLSVSALSQEKPITQSEYVKILYSLQKDPSVKTELIDALRKRGIAFQLTDGLRGLTRSKGGNDEELKRALEEAERRRKNPEASRLPSSEEGVAVLEKARSLAMQALDEMPDFVVKQLVSRFGAFAGTGNWRTLDTLVIAVSYHSEKGEQYRVIAKNGVAVPDAKPGESYFGLGGATSTGQFVENLATIFKATSKTRFDLLTTDVLRGRRTLVYEYVINIENNKGRGITYVNGSFRQSSPAGEKGRIWIDRETFRILRIENQSTDITPRFPITATATSIDFDVVEIANEKYLLPTISDVRFTVQDSDRRFETKNVIRFKNYQRYGSDVKIVEEDMEPVPDEKP